MVLVAATAAALPPAASAAARYVPGEALVRYEPGTTPADRAAARDRADVTLEDVLALPRTQLVSFHGSVGSAVARLERAPDVLDAQPNYSYRASAVAPNDSFFGEQWGLGVGPGVDVLPAWDHTRGAGQVIAVVDTGIDLTHPDLLGNLWVNPGEIAANALDDDGNGKADDLHGYDFVTSDPDPDDLQYHGTHVAGIAAALAGNTEGAAGVAPEAQLMALRALDGNGFGSTAEIAQAIVYAVEEGAGIINLSIGGPSGVGDSVLANAIAAAGSADAVVVAAAGNAGADNDDDPTVPCALPAPNLICVAALNSNGALAGYSNTGVASVDVGAPGTSILSSKTDWGAPIFSEDFEAGLADWTNAPGSIAWAETTPGAGGTGTAVTDSPGGPYAANTDALLTKASPVLLGGQRGCRMHFDLRSDVHASDDLRVGAITDDTGVWETLRLPDPLPAFEETEVSISTLDGRDDVYPTFELSSDGATEADGASVDNLRVLCRAQTYDNSIVDAFDYEEPDAGSYMSISGTSMATPHVSGVAALVRAADPGVTATEVIDAIVSGGQQSTALAWQHEQREARQSPRRHRRGSGPRGRPATHVAARDADPAAAAHGDALAAGAGRVRHALSRGPAWPHDDPHRGRSGRARHVHAAGRRSPGGRPEDRVPDLGARPVAVVRDRLNRTGRRLLRRSGGRLRARVRAVLTNAAGLRSVTTHNRVVLAMH